MPELTSSVHHRAGPRSSSVLLRALRGKVTHMVAHEIEAKIPLAAFLWRAEATNTTREDGTLLSLESTRRFHKH